MTVQLYAFKHHKHKEQAKLCICMWPAALLLRITNASNSSSSSLFNNGNISTFSKANASLVYTVNTVIYVKVRISAPTLTNFNSVHVSRTHIMEQCHTNTISTLICLVFCNLCSFTKLKGIRTFQSDAKWPSNTSI